MQHDRLKRQVRKEYDRERLAGIDEIVPRNQGSRLGFIMVDAVLNWDGESIEGSHVGQAEFQRFAVVVWDFYEKFTAAYNKVVEEVPE